MDRTRSLPGWVQMVVLAACVVTVAVAAVGPRELWFLDYEAVGMSPFWFQNGLALGVGAWIVMTALPRSRQSRVLRVAVLLPIAHAIVLALCWAWWTRHSPDLPRALYQTPLQQVLPLVPVISVLAFVCITVGTFAARRMRDWLQGTAMMALSYLLLLGLWIPLACRWWGAKYLTDTETGFLLDIHSRSLLVRVLLPPLCAAIAFTLFGMRRMVHSETARASIALGALSLFLAALGARIGAPAEACVVYANFFHVLIAAGLVAIGSIAALGAASFAYQPRRGRLEGVVMGDQPVAGFQIRSWLRAPTPITAGFTLATPRGDIPVPPGAALDVPLPIETLRARFGETVHVLRGGDRITLTGFELEATGDGPFRGAALPQPGADGIAIGTGAPRGFTNVALAIWRPCVAYLLILVAVAIPALASTLRPMTSAASASDDLHIPTRFDIPTQLVPNSITP